MQNDLKIDEIPARIQYLMKKMELNQAGMARAFGLSNTAMSQYLTGKRTPTVEMLAKIVSGAQEMGLTWVTMDFMVFGKELPGSIQVADASIIDKKYDLMTTKILNLVLELDIDKKRIVLRLLEYIPSTIK